LTKISGKNLYASFAGTNLSTTQRSLDVDEQQESADSTAGADSYRNYVATVKTMGAKMEILLQEHSTGGSAQLAVLLPGAEGTFLWGVEGTTTGKPKDGFYARVKNASKKIKFDDVYMMSLELENAGTGRLYNGVTDLWP
jgi:hypothetical protein